MIHRAMFIITSFIEDYLHPTRQDGSPDCDTSEHPGTRKRARGWQCWGPAGNACTTNVAHSAPGRSLAIGIGHEGKRVVAQGQRDPTRSGQSTLSGGDGGSADA